MKTMVVYALFASLAITLPGCGNLYNWGTEVFYQGEPLDKKNKRVKDFIRSVSVYDQFSTRGIFDVMWLSDEVRTAYTNLYAFRHGKTQDHANAFLRRQLEENNHFISFYVLSLHEITLGDTDSEWNIVLDVDGKTIVPSLIKAVDLPPEYRIFFGKFYTRFKLAYLVKFKTKDIEENPYLTSETQNMVMHFRSVDKEVSLTWNVPELLSKKPL